MEKSREIRRVAYVRKSSESEDRQVLSIPAQLEELNRVSQADNFKFEKFFSESHSAKNPGRPVFDEMLGYIEKGKANAIVSWAPNRLSRNSIDTGRIIHLMDLGKLIEVRTPGQVFKNNPNDKFLLNLFCSQAKLENDNKGEDVKRGLRTKVNHGWFPGAAPIGYINTPDKEKGFKIIKKDSERFLLVRKIWDMALSGKYSVKEIHSVAMIQLGLSTVKRKRVGGKALSLSGIYRVLTDSFYYGEFEFPKNSGLYYEGKHPPMITKEEFNKVQIRLGNKRRPRSYKKQFAYTGPISCGECGCQITAEEKHQMICSSCKCKFSYPNRNNCPRCGISYDEMKNPKILYYVYYRCTKQKPGFKCSQKFVEVKDFESQLKNYLNRINIKKSYLDWAVKFLKEDNAVEAKTAGVILKSRQNEVAKLSSQLERLLEMRVNEEINAEEFKVKRNKLISMRKRIQELMQSEDSDQAERIDKCISFFEFCFTAVKSFEEAKKKSDFSTLKNILMTLGSNLVLKDKKLFISLLKPFEIVEQGIKNIPDIKATFEPERDLENNEQNVQFDSASYKWLPVVNEVRTWYLQQFE